MWEEIKSWTIKDWVEGVIFLIIGGAVLWGLPFIIFLMF